MRDNGHQWQKRHRTILLRGSTWTPLPPPELKPAAHSRQQLAATAASTQSYEQALETSRISSSFHSTCRLNALTVTTRPAVLCGSTLPHHLAPLLSTPPPCARAGLPRSRLKTTQLSTQWVRAALRSPRASLARGCLRRSSRFKTCDLFATCWGQCTRIQGGKATNWPIMLKNVNNV